MCVKNLFLEQNRKIRTNFSFGFDILGYRSKIDFDKIIMTHNRTIS